MEFHHMFCLEEGEMGVTDGAEHVIELLPGQDKPFKERFCRIAPHDVKEVRWHIQEMLDGGAIRPSQSPWCNAIVLVWKKDGTLQFCIDFRRLNARTKKDSYLILRGLETMESLVGCQILLHHGPQEWVLAGEDVREVLPVHSIHCRKHGRVRVSQNALWLVQCTCHVSVPYAKLSWRAEFAICLNLPGQCHHLLQDTGRSPDSPASSTGPFRPSQVEAETVEVSLL